MPSLGTSPIFFGASWFSFSISLISVTIIALSSQLLNFYNFMNGIKPRDLCVFRMLSGLITPISIGIHDKHITYKLLIFSRKCIKITEYLLKCNSLLILIVISSVFLFKITSVYLGIYVLPHILLCIYYGYYLYAITITHLTYYAIITYYLTLKIKSTSNEFININKIRQNIKLQKIIHKFRLIKYIDLFK